MRPCLSPGVVSPVSPTFHFSDELIRGVVFVLGCFVLFVWVRFVAGGIGSSGVLDLEPAALLLCSPLGPRSLLS